MKNSKIIPIIKNDVERSIKNKWFVILNIILFLVIVVSLNYNNIRNIIKENDNNENIEGSLNSNVEEKINIYIKDDTNTLYSRLSKSFNEDTNVIIEQKESIEEYKTENIDINIILVEILESESGNTNINIYSRDDTNEEYISIISDALTSIKEEEYIKNNNLSTDDIENIKRGVEYNRVYLAENVEENSKASVLNIASNYVIFFILLLVLSKIASIISTEKSSKSIEYVLTSISVKEYLLSKVIGVCAIVLIQFILVFVYAIIGVMFGTLITKLVLNTDENVNITITGKTIGYFAITLLLMIATILLQSLIQCMFSAKTTNIQEAGNTTFVLIVLNLVLYILNFVLISPTKSPAIYTYVFSCLPIVSMYFVPAMYIIGQANVIQIIASIILDIALIPIVLKLIEKPFKNAILDYTPKKENKIIGIEKIYKTREYQERMIERKKSAKRGMVIGFSVILVIVLQIVGSLIESMVLPVLAEKIPFISKNSLYLIILGIIYVISLIIPYLVLRVYLKENDEEDNIENEEKDEDTKKEERKKSIKQCIKYIILAIPVISIIQSVCSFAIEKLGVTTDVMDSYGMFNASGKLYPVLLFIVISILPAIFEELYVRKGIMGVLKSRGAIFATIVSSVIFAIIHLNISQFIFAFLIGIVFGIIRTKTNKLYPTMILHFLNNGLAMIEVLLYKYDLFMTIFTYFKIALNAIGFCILVYMLYKKIMELKDKENVKKLKEELDYRKLKLNIVENMYVFKDYTFLVATILSITLFISFEKILAII